MKRYEKYKDSGVEWIGEIPEHWDVKKLRYVAKINPSKPSRQFDKSSDDEIVFLPMEKVFESGEVNQELKKRVNEVSTGFTYFERGDIIVAKITPCFENGKGALLDSLETDFGYGSTEFHTLRALESIKSKLLFYISKSEKFMTVGEAFMSGSAGQKRVPSSFVENFIVGIPPDGEQTAIASYLDDKTARIDILIANKQRLIELLKEERTAIINHAVTKGINPKARLKPSGIEWLGDIPEHWEVCKLKHLIKVKDGTHDTPDYIPPSEESYPLITSKDIKSGKIDFSDAKHISKEDYAAINERSDVAFGDVIMPMIGTVGGAALVTTEKKFSIKNVALFKTSISDVNGPYFSYLIDSKFIYSQFDLASRGGVQGFVSLDVLRNLLVFKIEFQEQANIVRHIEFAIQKIDAAISKIEKEIELMQEYRTALISEVVTGKIKVI